jgi:serine/threonine-protein kinase
MNTDHNLLFGVLALQMDFVGREALIAAMNAWVLNKSQPLGEVLVKQGSLTADRYALLQALVKEHLKQHDNDPGKSLAAVPSIESLRRNLEHVRDAELQKSLVDASIGHSSGSEATAVTMPPIGSPSLPSIRFSILRPHAKGGLGEVFVALDNELHREVALKQIQERHADDLDARARFVAEAEITGGLEHPGIVPVYGLGHYADGRPFYAMRFIRGRSLDDEIERFHKANELASRDAGERELELRKLLGRFNDACNAIAYAHSRRVIHRDLKPRNIMLGPYGETLVVDWGLAKSLDAPPERNDSDELPLQPSSGSGSSPTQMGSARGTPQYMSPEQAAGRLDRLSPATDVYGLGATLYCLLTGRPPFQEADLGLVLQKVQRGDFLRPREVNSDVPVLLEAICLKAMAASPENRYASPRDLAEDIEHWLADEPVSAYPEALGPRIARLARHHRSLTRAIVVVAFGLIIATSLAVVFNNRQQAAEEHSREADRHAAEVEHLANEAEQQRRQAVGALDNLSRSLNSGELSNRRELQPLRETLLSYYEDYVREHPNDPLLQGELAMAYDRMAKNTRAIAQKSEALDYYRKAEALYVALLKARHDQPEYGVRLVENRLNQVLLLQDLHDWRAVDAIFDTAEDDLKALPERPKDLDYQSHLAEAYHITGEIEDTLNERENALTAFRHGRDIRIAMVRESAKREYRRDLARSYGYIGDVLLEQGKDEEALQAYKDAEHIRVALVDEDPTDWEAKFQLARSYQNTGRFYSTGHLAGANANPLETAINAYKQGRLLEEELVSRNPANTQYRYDLGWSCLMLAELYIDSNQPELAAEPVVRARDIFEELVLGNDNDMSFLSALARSHADIAKLYIDTKPADAREAIRLAKREFAKLSSRQTEDEIQDEDLYTRAVVQALGGEGDAAIKTLNDAVDKGFNDVQGLKRDRAFKSLASRPDWAELVQKLEHKVKAGG